MKILVRTGTKRESMATPSIWLWSLLLKRKWVSDVGKRKSFLSSFLVVFRLELRLKMRFIAKSMVSWSGILVKRVVTLQETRNFRKDLHS